MTLRAVIELLADCGRHEFPDDRWYILAADLVRAVRDADRGPAGKSPGVPQERETAPGATPESDAPPKRNRRKAKAVFATLAKGRVA